MCGEKSSPVRDLAFCAHTLDMLDFLNRFVKWMSFFISAYIMAVALTNEIEGKFGWMWVNAGLSILNAWAFLRHR